jgi:hypothetical protein
VAGTCLNLPVGAFDRDLTSACGCLESGRRRGRSCAAICGPSSRPAFVSALLGCLSVGVEFGGREHLCVQLVVVVGGDTGGLRWRRGRSEARVGRRGRCLLLGGRAAGSASGRSLVLFASRRSSWSITRTSGSFVGISRSGAGSEVVPIRAPAGGTRRRSRPRSSGRERWPFCPTSATPGRLRTALAPAATAERPLAVRGLPGDSGRSLVCSG